MPDNEWATENRAPIAHPGERSLPQLQEDTHGVIPYAGKMSLFQIESELLQLMEFAEDPERTDEERAAADEQIKEYISREIRKVDNIRAYLRHAEVMEAAAKAEYALQRSRAEAWKSRATRLKDRVLQIMQVIGEKKLEGKTGTLTVKGNGGLQPLVIRDETLIPPQYCKVMVTMSLARWLSIQQGLEDVTVVRCVDNDLVRRALSEPCPLCHGLKRVIVDEVLVDPCNACGGEGTRRVPGARLEPRGNSLIVK